MQSYDLVSFILLSCCSMVAKILLLNPEWEEVTNGHDISNFVPMGSKRGPLVTIFNQTWPMALGRSYSIWSQNCSFLNNFSFHE